MFKLFGKKPAKAEKAAPAEEGCGCGCGHHEAPKTEAKEESCCGGDHEKEGGCCCGGH